MDLTFIREVHPKHEEIRVISIGDFDVQACGTHHDQTSKIGELRIIRSSQVQDGVERLQIVAGETSRENSRRQERILSEASDILGVQSDDLPKAVMRFFEEWKSQQKKIESLESEIVRLRTVGGGTDSTELDGVRYVVMEVEGDMKQMMTMLSQLTRDPEKPTLAILGTRIGGGKIIVASTEGTIASERHNAVEILNAISGHINGGGGGEANNGPRRGTNGDGIPNALEGAKPFLVCDTMYERIDVSAHVRLIEYAIRNVVVPAIELEKKGHEIIRLNVGDRWPLMDSYPKPYDFGIQARIG